MHSRVPKERRKGFNSIIILGAWLLSKQRNACIFDNAHPSVMALVKQLEDEAHLWSMAGARGLQASS
ncbi:hypothetical protein PR202_gb23919 [Eleusine coracana subsp. coracana]|uniref:Uncharacterized protein n=1 Tax=Eleusine coracana subsp. coracana TaxID=191504 RepID=A0AAV5FKP6_ELECO|nr:hypothetical protein PR202_gb23919 [Eleusine coracana subsp. coracana]